MTGGPGAGWIRSLRWGTRGSSVWADDGAAWRKAKRIRLGFLRGSRSRAASCRPVFGGDLRPARGQVTKASGSWSEACRIPGVGGSLSTCTRPPRTLVRDAARPGCRLTVQLREARAAASVAPLARCSGEIERSAWGRGTGVVGDSGRPLDQAMSCRRMVRGLLDRWTWDIPQPD